MKLSANDILELEAALLNARATVTYLERMLSKAVKPQKKADTKIVAAKAQVQRNFLKRYT